MVLHCVRYGYNIASLKQTTQHRNETMLNVKITYKSGKVENTQIKLSEYSAALVSLASEGRIVSMEIYPSI